MSDVNLRPARKSDAADMAILDNLAGYGLSQWYWKSVSKSERIEDAYAYGRQQHADDNSRSGWRSAVIATQGDETLGMSTCYIHPGFDASDPTKASLQKLVPAFAPIFELHKIAKGHWYLDVLAVYSHARGKRVGALLIDDCIKRGRDSGAQHMSLTVENGNTHAMGLYRSRGFEQTASRPFIEFDGPSKSSEWLLFTAEL